MTKLTVEYRNGPGLSTDRYEEVISAAVLADGHILQVSWRDPKAPTDHPPRTSGYSMHNLTRWDVHPTTLKDDTEATGRAGNTGEEELPGMWESADLTGGQTDTEDETEPPPPDRSVPFVPARSDQSVAGDIHDAPSSGLG